MTESTSSTAETNRQPAERAMRFERPEVMRRSGLKLQPERCSSSTSTNLAQCGQEIRMAASVIAEGGVRKENA